MRKASLPLTLEDKEFYQENGYLYIKDLYPRELLGSLMLEIYHVIGLLCERENVGLPRPDFHVLHFDAGLPALLKKDRSLGGIIYEAVKKVPSHIQLAGHPVHSEICRQILETDLPGFASRGWGLRLDHPDEDVYLTQLHQDYVSQLCSPRGIVFWTALRRTDQTLGPVVVYPHSHKNGVYPIEVRGAGSYGLRIHDEAQIESAFDPVCAEVEMGDCVIMDCLTLHKSSPNKSKDTRWALITRYFDFRDPVGQNIGWRGGLQEGNSFEKIFPDLVRRYR